MPNVSLNVEEKAALFALMTFVEKVSNPNIRARYGFPIDGKTRERLRREGFIRSDRDAGLPGRPYVLELTDKGWRWCRDELAAPPQGGASKAYRLLYGVLNNIDLYIRRSECKVEEFFVADDSPPVREEGAGNVSIVDSENTADIEKRIRSAYHQLVSESRGWVGLRRLRDHLADVPRADLDAALLRLALLPGIYLEREMNQKSLTDEDREAAIRVGNEPRHLLSIEDS